MPSVIRNANRSNENPKTLRHIDLISSLVFWLKRFRA